MNRRDMLASTAVVLSSAGSISAVGVAGAQQSPEIDQVREASTALYASLSSLDVGRVEGFWAHESYVRYIGPTSKAVAVGWDEVKKAIGAGNAALSARRVVLTQAHIKREVVVDRRVDCVHRNPSGDARTTASVPILPLAPDRLSTTIGWPSRSDSH